MKTRLIILIALSIIVFYFYSTLSGIKIKALTTSYASNTNLEEPIIKIKKSFSAKKVLKKKDPKSGKSRDNFSKEFMYCLIKKLNAQVPLYGDIQMMTSMKYVDKNHYERSILIKSSDCPEDSFSVVTIRGGEIVKELNCMEVNFEELLPYSSEQLEIYEAPAKQNEYNLAINGRGQFLVYCPGGGKFLTRNGVFKRDPLSHFIKNEEGCFLWSDADQKINGGFPLIVSDPSADFNEYGCLPDGSNQTGFRCLAILKYDNPAIKNLEYRGSDRIKVKIDGPLISSNYAQVFSNSLEDFSESEHPLNGIKTWENIPYLEQPIDCRDY